MEKIEEWLHAFDGSPKLLQSLAVLLMPIFPEIYDFNEECYELVVELVYPDSAADSGPAPDSTQEVRESAADTPEPDKKRSRLE